MSTKTLKCDGTAHRVTQKFFKIKSRHGRAGSKINVRSLLFVRKLEKEESERARGFHFLERPEGDEVVTDADGFHNGGAEDFIYYCGDLLRTFLFFREDCPTGMITHP
jgi:hypothetical protein